MEERLEVAHWPYILEVEEVGTPCQVQQQGREEQVEGEEEA